jgi:light-regulated signal transduction histidine kinase (bacteriophytochrome)
VRGRGLIGRVWDCKQPVWLQDVTQVTTYQRATLAAEVGLRAAVGMPVLAGDELVAVMAFFMAERRDEDERLVRLISTVAAQLGSFIQRKRAEEENRRLNAELELRVIERTTQLEAANRELAAVGYSVSHDLRGPLRAIDGFSQALLEDYRDKIDAQGQEYLERIRAAAQRMAELLDALSGLLRVSRHALQRHTVDLSALAHAIVDDLRRLNTPRQVTWIIADGLIAQGDAQLLSHALSALLENAWKFTSKHPQAQIEFGALVSSGGTPVYFVHDDGAGFNMAYADKLFAPFQRLHRITEFDGTGIGLATVQRIIHLHGGRVWAEGAVEQGATFYFTL